MELNFDYEIPKKPFRSGTLKISYRAFVTEHDSKYNWKPLTVLAVVSCEPFEFGLSSDMRLVGRYQFDRGWRKLYLEVAYPARPTVAEWTRHIGNAENDDVIEKLVFDAVKETWTDEVSNQLIAGAQQDLFKDLMIELDEVEERHMDLENFTDQLHAAIHQDTSEE